MRNLKVKTFIKIIFLVSLFSIISAYFIEYVLGHQPCNLCLIERIPYGLAMVLIILNHISIKNEKFIILLLILVFFFSLVISFYHFGIEQDIFEESSVCGLKDVSNIVSKEELLKQLQVKNVSCKDVTFKIFGFSLTSLNMIINLILIIFLSKIFKNYEKFKK
jgi:disulfide bond formation protein DsbB